MDDGRSYPPGSQKPSTSSCQSTEGHPRPPEATPTSVGLKNYLMVVSGLLLMNRVSSWEEDLDTEQRGVRISWDLLSPSPATTTWGKTATPRSPSWANSSLGQCQPRAVREGDPRKRDSSSPSQPLHTTHYAPGKAAANSLTELLQQPAQPSARESAGWMDAKVENLL